MSPLRSMDGGTRLPESHGSLARGVPPSAPGTIFTLTLAGGIALGSGEGREVIFGRNRPDVHVCLGEDDLRVSRRHGSLVHRDRQWWLHNTGRLPIRLPGARLLFGNEEPVPLAEGYTPLFVRGSNEREHLLEVYVAGADGRRPAPRHEDVTRPPRMWALDEDERLALIVLGQRYLLHEPRPQPLSWHVAAAQLAELRPDAGWTRKKVEHLVLGVRNRLSAGGVAGLTRAEIGEPVGNALNHNLIRELLLSTTLVPPDLAVLDEPPVRGEARP
ncbi:FHA domain-containing protein [Actinoallomurus oryzae]